MVVDSDGRLQSSYHAEWEPVSTTSHNLRYLYELTIRNDAGELVYSKMIQDTEYVGMPDVIPGGGWLTGYARTNNGEEVLMGSVAALDGGTDTLEFGEGISLSNLSFVLSGSDMIVTVDGGAVR